MHRKANALAEFLDIRHSPEGRAAVAARYRDLQDELEALAWLADEVRRLRPEGPDTAWKLRTRQRLVAWARGARGPQARSTSQERRAGAGRLQSIAGGGVA